MFPLLGVVQALKGAKVTVEMKNGLLMKGTVDRIDKMMNIYLEDAEVIFRNHKHHQFTTLTVRGNNIAYIVPPDGFDPDQTLQDVMPRTMKNDQPGPSGKGKGKKKKGKKEEFKGVSWNRFGPPGQGSGIRGTPGRGNGMRGTGDATPGKRDGMPGRGDGMRGRREGTRRRGGGTRAWGGVNAGQKGGMHGIKGGIPPREGGHPVQYTVPPRQS